MAEQDLVAVEGALRRSGGAGGEDHQRRVVGPGVDGGEFAGVAGDDGVEVFRVACRAVGAQDRLEVRQRAADRVELGEAGGVGDDRLRPGAGEAVAERVVAEEGGKRNRDRAELVGGEVGEGGRDRLGQQHRDPVAALQAPCCECMCERVGALLQLAIGCRIKGLAGRILQERDTIRYVRSPCIRTCEAHVEAGG